MDEDSGGEGEVAVLGDGEAVDVFAFLEWMHAHNGVVVPVPVAPVVVQTDVTLDLDAAGFAGTKLIREFATLRSSTFAPVVRAQVRSPPRSIASDGLQKLLTPFPHVPEDVACPAFCVLAISLGCQRFRAERGDAAALEVGRVPILVALDQLAVERRVVVCPQELEILGAVVRGVEVLVVYDCSLPRELRDRSKEPRTRGDPMRFLPAAGVVLLDERVTLLVRCGIERHQGRTGSELVRWAVGSIAEHEKMVRSTADVCA